MVLPHLTKEEIERRMPVWQAFANLLLDTDPALSYDYIVSVMRESPYTREQLFLILEQEVAPAFISNLMVPAGEWVGWYPEEVRRRVLGRARRARWLSTLLSEKRPFHDSYVDGQWHKLMVRLDAQPRLKRL